MNQQKRKAFFLLFLLFMAGTTAVQRNQIHPLFSIVRYLSLAYAVTYIGYLITAFFIRKKRVLFSEAFLFIGSTLLLFYTVMTLDTFLFHALNWYPGMFRYAMFSSYGVCYLVFLPIGGFIAAGLQDGH